MSLRQGKKRHSWTKFIAYRVLDDLMEGPTFTSKPWKFSQAAKTQWVFMKIRKKYWPTGDFMLVVCLMDKVKSGQKEFDVDT